MDVYDMGWGAADWNDLTDENGNVVLVEDGPTNEHKRIVAWMDGEGMVHQEDASITLSIESSWGVFSTTIDAPTTPTANLEVDLPYVAVTAVSPESDSGFANSSVPGMITVSNTGDAPVSSVSIWCYDGDEVADTPNVVVSLAPGESKDVPFTWYAYTAGEATLNCRPLLPTALDAIADDVVDLTGATSTVVTWEYAAEEEEAPILIFAAVVVGFIVFALIAASQRRGEAKTYTTHDELPAGVSEPASAESNTDDTAVEAEEHSEPDAEPDGSTEDSEGEAEGGSIYDFAPDGE